MQDYKPMYEISAAKPCVGTGVLENRPTAYLTRSSADRLLKRWLNPFNVLLHLQVYYCISRLLMFL